MSEAQYVPTKAQFVPTTFVPTIRHPGGEELTARLLELAKLPPCRVLDMGAGDGAAVALLRARGFDADGIDKNGGEGLLRGDFLRCPFPDGAFDAVLSECAFFVSGNPDGALREAARLLSPGGKLLLSDVYFGAPEDVKKRLCDAHFRPLAFEDATAEWKAYYIECLWNGTADTLCGKKPEGKCGYYLAVAEAI